MSNRVQETTKTTNVRMRNCYTQTKISGYFFNNPGPYRASKQKEVTFPWYSLSPVPELRRHILIPASEEVALKIKLLLINQF